MTAGPAQAPPQIIVVFGASGDLTRRKIIPALYNLAREKMLPEQYAVVGYARSDMDDDAFRRMAREAIEEFSRTPLDDALFENFSQNLSYISGPYDEEGCFAALDEHIAALEERVGATERLYYCAVPPNAFPHIISRLGECAGRGSRIVIEKPFGRDLETARELNEIVHRVFDEHRVFRIDHYLGKETVQNIVVFRFANAMFERVWNRDAIDHVQITVAESVGVEDRAGYYEKAGALRDMVQSHVLQLLTFVAMDPPRSLEPEAVRDEKVKVLRALRPFSEGDIVRGQYGPGDGAHGYRDEDGVAADSDTETFVAVRATVDNWRWAGVPFYLRTGKRLKARASEIAVVFREAPTYLFEGFGIEAPPPNHLVIRVQPDEGISFAFQSKVPGPGFTPKTVEMDFDYDEFFTEKVAEAYERLIHDAMCGDNTLFTREDEVERSWEIVAPVLDRGPKVEQYPAGSWGPKAADDLIAPRHWHPSRVPSS